MYWIYKIFVYLPLCIFFPTIVKGIKNIPKGKCVIVCNHKSNMDPVLLLNFIWRKLHMLGKKELFKKGIKSAFLKSMCVIPVDRKNVEISTIKHCLTVLKQNKRLTIFPEGTRNKESEELGSIKQGAAMFALKASAPIIPIIIQKRPKMFHLNRILIGNPIVLNKDYNGKEGIEKATKDIETALVILKEKFSKK